MAALVSKSNSDAFHVTQIHCGRSTSLAPVLKNDLKGSFF